MPVTCVTGNTTQKPRPPISAEFLAIDDGACNRAAKQRARDLQKTDRTRCACRRSRRAVTCSRQSQSSDEVYALAIRVSRERVSDDRALHGIGAGKHGVKRKGVAEDGRSTA